MSDVAVGDADRDGRPEVVAAGADGRVYVFQNQSGGWTRTALGSGASPFTSVLVADADGDGRTEVYAGHADGHVHTFTWQAGAWRLWAFGAGPAITSLATGDADHDGRPELYAGREDGLVARWDFASGGWQGRTAAELGARVHDLEVGDGDRDGRAELFAATGVGLVELTPALPRYREAWVVQGEEVFEVEVGDADNRAGNDLYLTGNGTWLRRAAWTGSSWRGEGVRSFCCPTSALVVGDRNRDFLQEAYVATADGALWRLFAAARTNHTWDALRFGGAGIATGLALGDGDGDGLGELYASNTFGTVLEWGNSLDRPRAM
jgi:hypothetical protein